MNGMRLQKYIAICGVASRRKAEEMIEQGRVTVNGTVISTHGYIVESGDSVFVDGNPVSPEEHKVYILLNKPRSVVSTASDDKGRKTVLDCIEGVKERLYPVGRLDFGTTGLIILSNDGEFTKFMTHPSHNVSKTYIATANADFDQYSIDQLKRGIDIGGYVTAPANVSLEGRGPRHNIIRITIFEGKNRQIRRMVEAVGLEVLALHRIGIGNITDSKLKPGEWRNLTFEEIKGLGYDIG